MAKVEDYKELEVFKECRKLVKMIYEFTTFFPKEEIYGLTNQIRRSAVSVVSNISEEMERQHTNDTIQFMSIARGSRFELEAQTILASELGFLNKNYFQDITSLIKTCLKLQNGFINYLKTLKK
jgi:four helix bundle protein